MTEEQIIKYIFLPFAALLLLAGFGLAILIPLFVLLFYVGKGL